LAVSGEAGDWDLGSARTSTEDFMAQTLRPLTIGELLDRTFFYYRRHFVLFVGIAALPAVFLLAFQLITVLLTTAESGLLLTVMFSLTWIFVYLVTTTLAHGATVVAVSQVLLGRETQVAEAFNSIRPRVGELIIISLNVGVRVLIGLLLFVVPGILLALRYSLTIPAAVLEETGISDSLSRSATLTKGHYGRILLVYFLLLVLVMIGSMLWPFLTMIVAAIVSPAVRVGQTPVWVQIALQFGNFLSQSLLGPIMTIALTLVYYDERVRKEAFDLEHMMRQLDRSVLPAPHPA
jgi:glycerophosphoryl diester phosphodiesterase family protein